MTKTEITKNDQLVQGDIVEFHFDWIAENVYLRAVQLSMMMTKLENAHKDFELISHSSAGDELILTYKVIASSDMKYYTASVNPALVITSVIVIGGGLFAWLTAGKIYKITQAGGEVFTEITSTATGKLAVSGFTIFLVAIGIYLLFGKVKK